jgi:hypothetical protein
MQRRSSRLRCGDDNRSSGARQRRRTRTERRTARRSQNHVVNCNSRRNGRFRHPVRRSRELLETLQTKKALSYPDVEFAVKVREPRERRRGCAPRFITSSSSASPLSRAMSIGALIRMSEARLEAWNAAHSLWECQNKAQREERVSYPCEKKRVRESYTIAQRENHT